MKLSYKSLFSGTFTVNSTINITNISSYTDFIIQTNFGTFKAVKGTNGIMCIFGYPTSNASMYVGSLRLEISGTSVKYTYAAAYVFTANGVSQYSGSVNILQILAR